MLSDRYEQDLAQILKAGLPAPSPDCEARVLAALADVRPRRHPNLLTIIVVAVLILLLAAALFAAVRHFFIEGTLQFHEARWTPGVRPQGAARYLTGEIQWTTRPTDTVTGDISPDGDEIVFAGDAPWPPESRDLFIRKLDGSAPINLTEAGGVGGVNCKPKWSPDGTMIAFQHFDPVEGMSPCKAGCYLWVMNADGTNAHSVPPDRSLQISAGNGMSWSPDGSRLLSITQDWRAFTTDIWGQHIRVLPSVEAEASWSPDGSMIVTISDQEDQVRGQPGVWKRLLLTDADGANPRILVQDFTADADIEARHRTEEQGIPGRGRSPGYIRWWLGPRNPVWSPNGDKIAFIAALPFDPDGLPYRHQIEVWVYDLSTDELTQITDDDVGQLGLIWR